MKFAAVLASVLVFVLVAAASPVEDVKPTAEPVTKGRIAFHTIARFPNSQYLKDLPTGDHRIKLRLVLEANVHLLSMLFMFILRDSSFASCISLRCEKWLGGSGSDGYMLSGPSFSCVSYTPLSASGELMNTTTNSTPSSYGSPLLCTTSTEASQMCDALGRILREMEPSVVIQYTIADEARSPVWYTLQARHYLTDLISCGDDRARWHGFAPQPTL
ncbi:hypothetical protein PLEOSDRAFT_1086197 [Pleurotus ostreatus PC15]|uniref:Uncharacterized protein n=1 Tax=Pleurotus ostreatus (strain PC15) TaxID=1137138 RepID=A0A067N7D1_PLEO1|nr:hypothetical protein PLEOSDRAFT_1086197 [Pleurotus ostreatus PC15]